MSGAYVCVVCGVVMLERACRVRCPRCGYFEDCENGLTPPPVDPGSARAKSCPQQHGAGTQILARAIRMADEVGRPEEQ